MAAKEKVSVKSLSLAILLAFMASIVHGLDFPHVPSNAILPDIGCLSCHDLHGSAGSLLKASTPNPDMGGDNTEANNLCWSCHTGPALAPYRVPHSSDQISQKHGIWNIECKDCHDPHNQPQFQTFGSESFLATGVLETVVAGATSTLTDNDASWTVDEHAGRVVFPDVYARDRRGIPISDISYRILSNTATTLTVDGTVNTAYIAAGDTYGIVYGKIVRSQILVPGTSTWKQVKFFSNTGTNSFADSDATLDGVCQVCHTKTGHFKNDGTGADQLHLNGDRGDPNGTAGENCTEKCHLHIGGFGHGKGYTKSDLCIECHGHEEGTIYDPDGMYPYFPNGSTLTSRGFGSVIPHTTHTESWTTNGATWETTKPASAGEDDLRGPGIYCNTCHDIDNMPTFRKDGAYAADDVNADGVVSLEETSVCAECHSPGGDYNGVNSVDGSVGAKDNWHSEGIYDADYNFKPGKEKWCAGCHDNDPSHIVIADRGIDVTAPSVIGDENEDFLYGKGWGFYKTGHGTPSSTTLPASGGLKPGPDKSCTYCHQSIKLHIDGDQRTFDCSDGCDSDEYGTGYRMRFFAGSAPLKMPRDGSGVETTDFLLCLRSGCHGDITTAFTDPAATNSNFYDAGAGGSLHYKHLNVYDQAIISGDWSGNFNSRFTCIVCHNPHGTKNHSMIRTGELVGNSPILIWYYNSSFGALPPPPGPPNPDNITLAASDQSLLISNSVDPYCASQCHGGGNWRVITRTPYQATHTAPLLYWAGVTGFEQDGVSPDAAVAGTTFKFMVQYQDYDNDLPTSIYVWVDANDNGTYEDPTEKHALTAESVEPAPVLGAHYTTTLTLNKAGDNVIKYKFSAADADGAATGVATGDSTLRIQNVLPVLDWTAESGNYTSDGVHSDNGPNGGTYTFRIKYIDDDGDTCPASGSTDIQVWIDVNDNGYEAGEKFNMTEVDGGDTDCTTAGGGKLYTYDAVLSATGPHNYRFYASDGTDDAIGTPATSDSTVTVAADGNTVPVLSWSTESCLIDGVKPPRGANGTNSTQFEFKIKYTDEDNQCPTGGGAADIQVWIDEDKSSTYTAGEKHNLSPVDGDADCTTAGGGKLYNITGLSLAVNQDIPFEFHATDGVAADNAVGDPVTVGGTVDVYSGKTVKAAGGDYTTIQAAMDAINGDTTPTTLLVDPATYGKLAFSYADSNWTIISACGADLTTIDAGGVGDALFTADSSGTTIDGFTITGGAGRGFVTSGGNVTIKNSKIHGNVGYGAQIQTTVALTDVEVYNNSAGGITTNGGNYTFTNLTVRNNSSTTSGPGIFWQNLASPATLTNVTIKDNTTTASGGAMFSNGTTVNITNCTITGNQAGTYAGAWALGNSGSHGSLTNCVVANNTAATKGGAFTTNGGSFTVNNSTLSDNIANGGDGGMLWNQSGPTTITNSIIWNNSASGTGHVAYSNGGAVSITDSIIQNDGDGDFSDSPYLYSTNITFVVSGYTSEADPAFVDASANDYALQYFSDAIDNAGAGATATDRDGNTRTNPDLGAYEYMGVGVGGDLPTLAWTGEANFVSDAVNPDSAVGGSTFEFRVDYTDAEGKAPSPIELWVDENNNGAFENSEKYAMAAVGGGGQYGDGIYTNGERYTKSLALVNPGGGFLNYRIVASDGAQVASGEPAEINTVEVLNRAPTVEWPGDTNYESDGVHPDVGDSGASFTYRILYTDLDNTAPVISQVWIDENDSMFYDSGEYNDMVVETPDATQYRDGVYSNGEYFTFTKPIYKAGDGRLYYRFAFSDGVDDATGDPASQQLAKERYSRYFTVQEFKTVAGAVSVTAASSTSIDVSMAYTGDGDSDNTLKVEYGVKPADTYGWSTWSTVGTPDSPYETTITDLIGGETYDVRTTFIDPDGIIGTAVYTEGLTLPVYATTPLVATAVANRDPSITVTVPYTHDGNGNNTYTIKYRVNSPQGAWTDWGTNPKAHTDSPYTDTITGLASGETYDVQVTYNDPDGINGSSGTQTIMAVTMPTVYTVCPSGCDSTTIQAAIDAAAPGDMVDVKVSGSPYSENIVFDAGDDDVYVKSEGGFGSVTIRGLSTGTNLPVVKFSAAVSPAPILDGFTIDNQKHGGTLSNGIMIEAGANPTIRNCVIQGNLVDVWNANIGAGIHIAQGGATIEDSRIGSTTGGGGNNGEFGAGIYALTSAGGPYNLTITNSTISYNTVNTYGAGFNATNFNGTIDITGSTISNNSTSNNGAGVYVSGSTATVTIADSTISNNSTSNGNGGGIYSQTQFMLEDTDVTGNVTPTYKFGGGIYLNGADASLIMDGGSISNNGPVSDGGGVYITGSTAATPLSISNATLDANSANSEGGSIYLTNVTNASTLSNTTISNSTAQYGGGIWSSASPLTITGSTIDSNTASQGAGGMDLTGAATIVNVTDGSTISNNSARYGGGARVRSGSTLNLTDSTVASNTATDSSGAGIQNSSSTLTMTRSYLKGNIAGEHGGGLYNAGTIDIGATATLTNTIVSGNVAGNASHEDGGGILNNLYGTLNLYSCTIAGNYTKDMGGGLYTDAVATVAVENTIIYGNNSGNSNPDLRGSLTSTEVTYSDIGGWIGGGATNPTPIDPIFVSVDPATDLTPSAGGDYRLQGSSTLIDIGGGANVPADDIEVQARPVDGDGDDTLTDDIGADEYYDASDSTAAGMATAIRDSNTSIAINMPYTNDANLNNTYTVDYKLSSEPTTWTNWVTDAARVPSVYTDVITGLVEGETYDVRMTYNDINGVTGNNPQIISGIVLPATGKALLHPSGTASGDTVTYYGGTAAVALAADDGDGSYGRSTDSNYDYYLEIDDVGTIGTVTSLQVFVVARRDGFWGTANFDIDIISGSTTDSDNAYHALSTSSYQTFAGSVYNTDPNTGGAWTADAINNLKVRIDHRDSTDMRVTEVYVVINDTPAAPVNTDIHPSGAAAGDTFTYTGGTVDAAMDTNYGSTSYGWSGDSTMDAYIEMDDPSPVGDINSVTVYAVGRYEDFSSASFRLGLKTYGTEYFSGALSYTSTSYVTKAGTTYTTNPNTGEAWTWAEVNDLVAIVDHTDTDDMRVTELYIRVNHDQENILPARVTDLSVSNITDASVLLTWTAPGDDGDTGTATTYDIRYSTTPIVTANWGEATTVTGEPAPQVAGTEQTYTVTGLDPETMYYFAIRTADEVPNLSGLSNVPTATTTTAPLTVTLHPSGANASDTVTYTSSAATDLDTNDGDTTKGNSATSANDFYLDIDDTAQTGIITSVQVKVVASEGSGFSSAPTFNIGLKTNGSTYFDGGHTQSVTSYSTFSGSIYTTNPQTSSAWTWTEINDLVGIVDVTNSGNDLEVTELYVVVSYVPDTTAPAAVTNLATGTVTSSTVQLTWTAPGDDNSTGTASSYDVRYSTSVINDGNWASATPATGEPAPSVAGSSESFTVTGLNEATTYYFAMKTTDDASNTSNLSNVPSAATGADVTAPGDITNLAITGTAAASIDLSWTAPGNDGTVGVATTYDVRYSTSAIDDGNWASATQATGEPAPSVAGTTEYFTVTGLSGETTYYFAIKTSDSVPLTSGLSNVPNGSTQEGIAPAAVTLTAGSPAGDSVLLTWTSPGDDNNTGTATSYDIRYSTAAINDGNWASATQVAGEPMPQIAGSSEFFTVTGLSSSTTYYFALKTTDDVSNTSAISNSPNATTTAGGGGGTLTLHPSGANASNTVTTYTSGDASTAYDSQNAVYGISAGSGNDYYVDIDDTAQTGTITSVQVKVYARRDGFGDVPDWTIGLIENATTTLDGGHTTSSSTVSEFLGTVHATRPSDSSAWTWSDINSLVAVVDHTDVDGMQIDEILVSVDYTTGDGTAPDAVSNLAAGTVTTSSVQLNWTAPGDDGSTGTARVYDIRYSLLPIGPANWEYATQVTGEPVPSIAGSSETFTVTGLSPDNSYYFAIKTRDEIPHISSLSNVLRVVTPETVPPADVTDLATGAVTSQSVELSWTAPGDNGPVGTATTYDVRYSTSAINEGNWASATQATGEPAPSVGGTSESFIVAGLNASTTYYFAIKTADDNANWSGISNSPSGSTVADTFAPDAVSDLATSNPTTTTVDLSWTAPGDDGAIGTATIYDIRYSTSVINDGNWDSATQATGEPAPSVAGTAESFTVTGLSDSTTYYFAIKTADDVPNTSALSNGPSAATEVPDTTAPAAISDLATSNPTETSIDLSWTAPGDDNTTGTATSYDIRYSTSVINDGNWASATQATGEPAPSVAGTGESFTVTGLSDSTTYYFAIKTSDEVPNTSALSNVPSAATLTPTSMTIHPSGSATGHGANCNSSPVSDLDANDGVLCRMKDSTEDIVVNMDNPGQTGTIISITISTRVRDRDGRSDDTYKMGIQVGGTNYWDTTINNVPTSETLYTSSTWSVNPNTTVAWTWADLDAIIGLAYNINGSAEFEVDELYITINYYP